MNTSLECPQFLLASGVKQVVKSHSILGPQTWPSTFRAGSGWLCESGGLTVEALCTCRALVSWL